MLHSLFGLSSLRCVHGNVQPTPHAASGGFHHLRKKQAPPTLCTLKRKKTRFHRLLPISVYARCASRGVYARCASRPSSLSVPRSLRFVLGVSAPSRPYVAGQKCGEWVFLPLSVRREGFSPPEFQQLPFMRLVESCCLSLLCFYVSENKMSSAFFISQNDSF